MATVVTPGSSVNHGYFPETGAFAELVLLPHGSALEVGHIGWAGMAGWSAVFDNRISQTWVMCQTSGLFLRLQTSALAQAADQGPELQRRLDHYAAALIGQRAISAAGDRHHDVIVRAAHHLLAACDRRRLLPQRLSERWPRHPWLRFR
jgi:hypothetical protein